MWGGGGKTGCGVLLIIQYAYAFTEEVGLGGDDDKFTKLSITEPLRRT